MKLFSGDRKGFTLIELLIVIALLGALAIGLITALDPFEQVKKGTDTALRDNVNQVQKAGTRYYAIKNVLPWCPDTGACTDPAAGATLDTLGTMTDRLVAAGELKTTFTSTQASKLPLIKVYGNSTTSLLEVCFTPISKGIQADPNTKFNTSTGVEVADPTQCRAHTSGATVICDWCVQ